MSSFSAAAQQVLLVIPRSASSSSCASARRAVPLVGKRTLLSTPAGASSFAPSDRRRRHRRSPRVVMAFSSSSSSSKSSSSSFPEEMRAACEAVQLASELCRETQKVLRSNERVQKQDDSPVTVADFAAQAVVSHWLLRHHPSIALVAEETAECLRDGTEEGAELLHKVRGEEGKRGEIVSRGRGEGKGPLRTTLSFHLLLQTTYFF